MILNEFETEQGKEKKENVIIIMGLEVLNEYDVPPVYSVGQFRSCLPKSSIFFSPH